METITFSYSFDDTDNDNKYTRTDQTLSKEIIFVGEAIEAFQSFMSAAYGYKIRVEWDAESDASNQTEE